MANRIELEERARLHEYGILRGLRRAAEEHKLSAEKIEASKGMWREMARLAGQSFKEGFVRGVLEFADLVISAPDGSDMREVVRERISELTEEFYGKD